MLRHPLTVQELLDMLGKVKDKSKAVLLPQTGGGVITNAWVMENQYGVTLHKDGIPSNLSAQLPSTWLIHS